MRYELDSWFGKKSVGFMFVCFGLFLSQSRIVYSYIDFTTAGEGLQMLIYARLS